MTFEAAPGIRGFIRPMDLLFAIFAGLMGVFCLTGTAASRPPGEAPATLLIFLFPGILFGVLFLLPRLISIWRESAGARYTVTDRRIVIRNRSRLAALDLGNLPYLELDRSWITGPVIYFGQRQMYASFGALYGASPVPAFRGLTDAEAVYRIIGGARGSAAHR
jgi:hypothetical protein